MENQFFHNPWDLIGTFESREGKRSKHSGHWSLEGLSGR